MPQNFLLLNRIGVIAAGKVTSPVRAIDIALPAGYDEFYLDLSNFYFSSDTNYLSGAFSRDNGNTWICDPVNYDVYSSAFLSQHGPLTAPPTLPTISPFIGADGLILLGLDTQAIGATIGSSLSLRILPGDDRSYPQLFAQSGISWKFADGSVINHGIMWGALNQLATAPAPLGRVNYLRMADYGSGDLNSPDGADITAGSYRLLGVR